MAELDTDYWLDKAVHYENLSLTAEDEDKRAQHKKAANISFRKAMKVDGNPNFSEEVI